MPQQVAFNNDVMDDPIIGDATPAFTGGVVTADQANLLAETESSNMINCDFSRLGKITTRKGTTQLGSALPGGGIIQGMAYFWTTTYKYPVAACGGKIYKYEGGAWTQIATGGAFDNDTVTIVKTGHINNAAGYPVGTTSLTVSGFTGPVANGDLLTLYQRDRFFEYTIIGHTETGGNTTTIIIDNPGTVVAVYNNDVIKVKRLGAQINNPANYAGGATTIAIDGLTGAVGTGDYFVISGEEIFHQITGHTETGGNTTSITFSPGLQGAYVSSDPTAWIMFAKGNDKLYWTDGITDIYSWDGVHTGNLKNGSAWDLGAYPPPTACKIVIWFQNRLIASGIAAEPDAIYYSDFGDPTRWDKFYQSHRIGGGDGDPIIMLVPWMDLLMAVFKENSVYIVNMDPSQNPTPDDPTLLVASYAVKLITKHVGCGAPRTIIQVGGSAGDIFFLASDRQVRSLRRTLAAENQQELGQAISLPVKDLVELISATYLHHSVATYWNERYILAGPFTSINTSQYGNGCLVYNTALNVWQGTWIATIGGGSIPGSSCIIPTAFSAWEVQEGLLALLFGNSNGTVMQWLGDIGVDETAAATYQDAGGLAIATILFTRAYTFGDLYVWKTGLNVEFEFTDSLATAQVQVVKDLSSQPSSLGVFDTTSLVPLRLPFTIPVVLPTAVFTRIQKDLQRYGQFRELQFNIYATASKLSLRSIKMTGYYDTLQIQTLTDTPLTPSWTATRSSEIVVG